MVSPFGNTATHDTIISNESQGFYAFFGVHENVKSKLNKYITFFPIYLYNYEESVKYTFTSLKKV